MLAMSQQTRALQLGLAGNVNPKRVRCTNPISLASAGVVNNIAVNLTFEQNNDASFIDSALSMYVDNGGNANALKFNFSSGQTFEVPANTQGYVNILQPNPVSFTYTTGGVSTAYCMLVNVFLPPQFWTTL